MSIIKQLAAQHHVKWSYDPAVAATGEGMKSDPYMIQIAGKRGCVYLMDAETDLLAVDLTDGATRYDPARMQAVLGEEHQHNCWTFTADQLPAVLEVIKPRKRRQLSEATKDRLREHLAQMLKSRQEPRATLSDAT